MDQNQDFPKEKYYNMANYSTNQFKAGLKIILDNDPCSIIENEFVKPGKGQAFNRVKIRNLKTGRVVEKTFKSGESVPAADVVEKEMQYLYNDGEFWYFMDQSTYEQFSASSAAMAEAKDWLKEEAVCMVTLFNDAPLIVEPPNFVHLKIIETHPGIKGDTAGTGGKPAVLETGVSIQVPLFVQQDEVVKVDTRKGEYVGRLKR